MDVRSCLCFVFLFSRRFDPLLIRGRAQIKNEIKTARRDGRQKQMVMWQEEWTGRVRVCEAASSRNQSLTSMFLYSRAEFFSAGHCVCFFLNIWSWKVRRLSKIWIPNPQKLISLHQNVPCFAPHLHLELFLLCPCPNVIVKQHTTLLNNNSNNGFDLYRA